MATKLKSLVRVTEDGSGVITIDMGEPILGTFSIARGEALDLLDALHERMNLDTERSEG